MSTPPQPAAQQLAAPHTGAAPQSVPAAPELSSVAPVTARPQRSRSTAARRRRSRLVAAVVSLALVVGCLGALLLGDLPLTPAEVAACFSPDSMRAVAAGQGDFAAQVVLTWRLPRILAAVAFGAALGLSGALFQILTRNPLGSPDIIGFNAGAYTGVILTRTFLVGGALAVSMGALAGGVVVGIIIYALAYRNGVSGFRLIIVGIGMTAMLSAANTWLLLRASDEVALSLAVWGAGPLGQASWANVGPALGILACLVPLVACCVRPLRQLELGDDAAAAHGLPVEKARRGILAVGIALTCVVTAAAGPIAFVALAAPQVGRAAAGRRGISLVHSALAGASILFLADLFAQFALARPVPVGAITTVVGGVYVLVVVLSQRKGR